jgi:PAS domain S-box-containing protein
MNGIAGREALDAMRADDTPTLARLLTDLELGGEAELRVLFESLPVCPFVARVGGQYETLFVGQGVRRMTGFEPDAFTTDARFWADRIHPDDRDATVAAFQQAHGSGVTKYSYRWRVASGEYRWFEEIVRILPAAGDGKLLVGVWHDVTDARHADLNASVAAARLEHLLRSVHGGVLFTDEQRNIQLLNQDLLALFDVSGDAAALRGTRLQELTERMKRGVVAPERFVARIESVLRDATPALGEEIRLVDGRVLERDYVPLTDIPGGRASLWHYRDVTARKLGEQQLQQANRALEERVAERTRALDAANEQLQEQLAALRATDAQLRASLHDKEVLLREVHHRVKNNLQVITSILRLQSQHLPPGMERDTLVAAIGRVRSMALVHEFLYQTADLARIDLGRYLGRVLEQIAQAYPSAERVRLETVAPVVPASIELALPLGLIAVELVTNALRHAFPEPRTGRVLVEVADAGDAGLVLTVADDGVGFAATESDAPESGLGLDLVNALVRQIRATLVREHDGGTRYVIRIPRSEHG